MSDGVVIRTSDLNEVKAALAAVAGVAASASSQIADVGRRVDEVQRRQTGLLEHLRAFQQEFLQWTQQDRKDKQLAMAKTDIIGVRQEHEREFGHYAEVRRMATGLLQAVDADLVSHATLRGLTEETMVKERGYWLAPVLVAMAAWLRDDEPVARRALTEALQRDDQRTTLFFTLLTRRLNRPDAARQWLTRYLQHQNPSALEREFVVVLDGVANGLFGPGANVDTAGQIDRWLIELGAKASFADEQERLWSELLGTLVPGQIGSRFATLSQLSPTWPELDRALREAQSYARIRDYFGQIVDGTLPPATSTVRALDELLDKLTTAFDEEELPSVRKERLLSLIIEERGDEETAKRRWATEQQVYIEQQPLTLLLSNAAMFPEKSQASPAARRYAVALSSEWIQRAAAARIKAARQRIPATVHLALGDWRGTTSNGHDETQLLEALHASIDSRERTTLKATTMPFLAWFALLAGVAAAVYGVMIGSVIISAIGLAGVGHWFLKWRVFARTIAEIKQRFAVERSESAIALRTALAELVEWRSEHTRADGHAEQLLAYLGAMNPQQLGTSPNAAPRALLTA